MAFGTKTNERPGTRAQIRYLRVSAYKAREVLDLVRGKHVRDADEILGLVERDVARDIRKCLASAVANAANNDSQDPEALFVSACYADEGPTLKRWRPRARGRATRIRKRTCHITIIVSRQSDNEIRLRTERDARSGRAGGGTAGRASRRARVASSRQATETHDHDHDHDDAVDTDVTVEVDDVTVTDEVEADAAEATEIDDAVNEGEPTTELVEEATAEAEAEEPAAEADTADEADTANKDED
ncbi:MAG: rplV [Acidimicrobiales bacterium]|nr:rplV [Acidimicrobiales bacterium]